MKLFNKLICWICFRISRYFFQKELQQIEISMLGVALNECKYKTIYPYLTIAEDKRFWNHPGFDVLAILRAGVCTIQGNRQGGSTIDQQLVRTIIARRERTIERKVREICLAGAMNRIFSKKQIINAYIEQAYYGFNMHGYQAAITRLNGLVSEGEKKYKECFLVACLKYPLPRRVVSLNENRCSNMANRAKYIYMRQFKEPIQ